MIEFAPVADNNPDLALSPLLRGAQLTLDYIETNGPIGLTPLKALKRYFVQWAAEAFAWPYYESEDLYYLNKVLNEQDFPPLMILHDVLLSAKLVRHAKGAMYCTKLGKQLQKQPGALWAVLADHLLALDHAQYTRHGDRLFGNWDIFLNVINVEAQTGVSEDHLCAVLFGGSEDDVRHHNYRLKATFYVHVWTTPAAQELLFSDEHRSDASMCSACSRSTVWLLALMKSAGWLPNHVIALEAL